MSREQFLERVRKASRSGRRVTVDSAPRADRVGYVGGGGDLCQSLADEVTAVGGTALVVRSTAEANAALRQTLKTAGVRSILCWEHPVLEPLDLPGIVASLGIESLSHGTLATLPEHEQRQKMLDAEAGISSVDWAIAETGTLVLTARPGQERVVSLLPPLHIAVVAEHQMLPDLFDAFDLWCQEPDSLPSNLVLITGPSKTGDIELKLTTGVHGPGEWIVLICRNHGTERTPE